MKPEELFKRRAAPETLASQPGREGDLGAAMALELAKIAAAAIDMKLDWEHSQDEEGAEFRARLLPGAFAVSFIDRNAPPETCFGFGLEIEGVGDFGYGPSESIFGDVFEAARAHCNQGVLDEMPRRLNRVRCVWAKLAETKPEITGRVNERLAADAVHEGGQTG